MMSFGDRVLSGIQDLMGAPWGYHATGPHAFGCVGLVVEAYRRAGVRLRDPYQDCHAWDRRAGVQLLEQCERTAAPERGGIVIFATPHPRKQTLHLALVVSPTRMLGSLPETGVSELDWTEDETWASRFIGYARVKGLRA